jgi:hypothetical protein
VRDEFEDDKRGDKGSNLGGGGGGGNRHSYAKPNGGASLRDALGPAGRTRAGGRDATPTLGLHWANCVNSRIFLSRDRSAGVGGGGEAKRAGGIFVAPSHRGRARGAVRDALRGHRRGRPGNDDGN